MRVTRRLGLGTSEAERTLWLVPDQDLGLWFGLSYLLMDDSVLMDALRAALSRRIWMAGTFRGERC